MARSLGFPLVSIHENVYSAKLGLIHQKGYIAQSRFEYHLFQKALRKANKSPSKAARLVGLPHGAFIKRLTRHPDLERTPIKHRRKAIIKYDFYIIISSLGPNALNVAKILSQLPQHQDQSQLLKTITHATDDISFQAPSLGRARHLVKLLKAQKAKARIESIPAAAQPKPRYDVARHR